MPLKLALALPLGTQRQIWVMLNTETERVYFQFCYMMGSLLRAFVQQSMSSHVMSLTAAACRRPLRLGMPGRTNWWTRPGIPTISTILTIVGFLRTYHCVPSEREGVGSQCTPWIFWFLYCQKDITQRLTFALASGSALKAALQATKQEISNAASDMHCHTNFCGYCLNEDAGPLPAFTAFARRLLPCSLA